MKRTITRTALVTLLFLISFTAFSYAQTYYDVYLCDNGIAKLHMPEENTLATGDKVYWFLDGTPVGAALVYNGTAGSTDITVPTDLAVGAHKYTTAIETSGGCLGAMSDPFTVYKLPTKTLALSSPSNSTYCADNSSPIASTQITATATPGATLPDGIGYNYTWSVTKNGTPVVPVTSIGSIATSNTNQEVFTMDTKDAATYVISATVKYVVLPPNVGVLKAGDNNGCEVSTTTSQTVTVTPKPGKPTIILAN